MFGWGSTDINDLITNTAGVCLGYLIYYLLSNVMPDNLRKQFHADRVNEPVEVLLFAIFTFISMVTVQPWVVHSLLNVR
jgi:glycopeptide antibiotics resistance protein